MKRSPLNQKSYFYAEKILISNFANSQTRFRAILNECHNIYHMLEISLFERPRWDLEILKALGSCSCSVDQSVGDRIYAEQDIFYIPVPMFCIKAVKN